MNIYRLILLIFLLLFLFEDYLFKLKKTYKLLKWLSIAILILLTGFRGNIGRDTRMYIDYFNNLSFTYEYFKHTRFEFLYFILNGIIKVFTINCTILFLIIAAITFINLYKFINYFSVSFFYSITFYYCRWFFLKDFSGIRNALACSFFYIALIKLYEKKIKNYYLLILVSGLIHKSMFFYMTLPIAYTYISKCMNKRKHIYIYIY